MDVIIVLVLGAFVAVFAVGYILAMAFECNVEDEYDEE